MADFIFLVWGLIPVGLGFGFIFRPRRVIQAQKNFRKRMERFEKKLFKAHRVTGLAFLLLGVLFLLTYFYPVWIFKVNLVIRVILGALFPQLFQSHRVVSAVPVVWI